MSIMPVVSRWAAVHQGCGWLQQEPLCSSVPQLGLQHPTAGAGTGLHTCGDPISILLYILVFHSTQTLLTEGSYLQMGMN